MKIIIHDSRVSCVYRDCSCVGEGQEVEVPPDWFQNNGTPSCGACGADLEYLRTEIDLDFEAKKATTA